MNLYPDFSASFVQWPPTRIKPSGTVTIVAGGVLQVSGSDGRMNRLQFVVTNLDAAGMLKLATPNGGIFGTVFPQRPFTLPTSADFQIMNLTGGDIQVEVAELYPDTAFIVPVNNPGAPGTAPGGTPPGGGAPGGGGSGGGGGGGGAPRYSGGTRQGQLP